PVSTSTFYCLEQGKPADFLFEKRRARGMARGHSAGYCDLVGAGWRTRGSAASRHNYRTASRTCFIISQSGPAEPCWTVLTFGSKSQTVRGAREGKGMLEPNADKGRDPVPLEGDT